MCYSRPQKLRKEKYTQTHCSHNGLHTIQRDKLFVTYQALLATLHGSHEPVTHAAFLRKLANPAVIFVFVTNDAAAVVAMAQASRLFTDPHEQVVVNNVVKLPAEQGKGYGKHAMKALLWEVGTRWGPAKVLLTNSPRKGNAGFYEATGFTARTETNDDPTVVWVQAV